MISIRIITLVIGPCKAWKSALRPELMGLEAVEDSEGNVGDLSPLSTVYTGTASPARLFFELPSSCLQADQGQELEEESWRAQGYQQSFPQLWKNLLKGDFAFLPARQG